MNWDYLGVIVLLVGIALFGIYLKVIRPYLLARKLDRVRKEIKEAKSKAN